MARRFLPTAARRARRISRTTWRSSSATARRCNRCSRSTANSRGPTPRKNCNVGKFVEYLAAEHPDKSVRITRGYARGNTAVLLVSGESIAGKLVGEALLMKEKDAWRVDDELMELDSR